MSVVKTKRKINKNIKGKKSKTTIWSFLEKEIISLPVVKKEEKALLIITFLIFCLVLIIFWEIRRPQYVFVVMPSKVAADKQTLVDYNDQKDAVGTPVYWHSFGDNFFSAARLDNSQTNMHLDDMVSALMFPPKYEFEIKDCVDCDFDNSIETVDNLDYLSDLDRMPQPLPLEFKDKKILAASLNTLDKKQVASFVVEKENEEQAFVYFLEDNNYIPIITDKTKEKIITNYGRSGGIAVAGGNDNNFIILYSGYQGIAYHYLDGNLYDVSKFFGLKVVDGGFFPYIIKQGDDNSSVWYVLSRNSNRIKLIKLWQNDTLYIKGAIDLSYILLQELGSLKIESFNGGYQGEIKYLLNNNKLMTFSDYGFDNSQVRQVVSNKIKSKDYPIYKANIKKIGVYLSDNNFNYHENFPSSLIDMYLGDSMSNFKKVTLKQEIPFSGNNSELFFRLVFYPTPESRTYSPWLDNINIGYLVSF